MTSQLYSVLRSPHVSEKASIIEESSNQYMFEIDPRANKSDVKKAIEFIFSVSVISVNILNRKGKRKMTSKRKMIQKKQTKKAFVRLAENHSIDLSSFNEG